MSSLTPRDLTPGDTVLRLAAGVREAIEDHARRGYPHEVVGLLAGHRDTLQVTRAVVLENEQAGDDRARRFQVSALVIMKAEMALDAEGLEVVGYYHSHPDHPPNYSDTDLSMALPNMSYLITAVRGPDDAHDAPWSAGTHSWRLSEDRSRMHFESIEVGA